MGTLPGQLAYVFLIAILDAALISWVVLRWYRRSVRKLMSEGAVQGTAPRAIGTSAAAPVPALHSVAPAALSVALFEPSGHESRQARPQDSSMPRRRVVIAYCLGAALHSAVITAFVLASDSPRPLSAWFGQWWVFAWPIVPTLVVLLVLNRRETIRLTLGYVVIGALGLAVVTLASQVVRGSINDASVTNVFWFCVSLVVTASAPLALLQITGWRRVRAVTPLALSSTLVFGFALLLFREVLAAAFNLEIVRSALLDVAVRTSHDAMYYGVFMILVLPVGWVAWRLLQFLAARFERKRFSDVQLVVDCWWLIVTAEELAVHLSTMYGLGGIAVGIAAFAAYRIGVAVSLWRVTRQRDEQPRRLLLLRVFGYQVRTETLFDRVAQQWRFHGPVQLIAGADLAMRTVDPGDMLAFVSGRLAERYVATPADVAHRLGGLDMQRDPDGRFRVNEVYCRDNTWRPALQALLNVTDTVLMDLRSFSPLNAGCKYELEQLVSQLPPDRIVLVYDRSTDLRLLSSFLSEAWQRAGREPSADLGAIACVRVERNSWAELHVLMRRLLGLGQPHRLLALADLATV